MFLIFRVRITKLDANLLFGHVAVIKCKYLQLYDKVAENERRNGCNIFIKLYLYILASHVSVGLFAKFTVTLRTVLLQIRVYITSGRNRHSV